MPYYTTDKELNSKELNLRLNEESERLQIMFDRGNSIYSKKDMTSQRGRITTLQNTLIEMKGV